MAEKWADILPMLDGLEEKQDNSLQERQIVEQVKSQNSASEPAEDPTFSYDGYQIVRGEYFAHINEPSVTLADYKITVNSACIKKAPDTKYIQVLLNPDSYMMVIRPSSEDEKDSFCWCTASRKPRTITCKVFFAMLLNHLHWNPDYRYKFLGKQIKSNGEYLFVFDLTGPEIYQRQTITDEGGKVKKKNHRTPIYQENWQNQFGLPVEEHQKAVQINIFDGYAVFGITDPAKNGSSDPNNKGGAL